ncbi:MAG: hypothetical protein PHR43_02145 [Dehalococcoidales bacterium]|nr:hypothetical protein [Dehalococcoidales bacterium]
MADYTHLPLNEQIDALSGYYVPIKETRLEYNGREVVYMVGQAVVEASCCGFQNRAYVLVPGYIVKWQSKTNEKGLPVSEVQPITDKDTQDAIQKIIRQTEQVDQVDFWH